MAKRLNYQIGFTADTSSLKTALEQALSSLQKLGTQPNLQLTTQLREASEAALDLSNHLRNAFNQDTGKLDLITFNKSLKESNITLQQYANRLISIGPSGEEAFLNVAQAISKAELPLKRSNKLLNDLWITMKNTARWQLTSSVLHGFIGSVQTAYGYTKSLNASLNSIQVVTEKNAESMRRFAQQANRAAQALSTTTVDYTDASLIYYQQGLTDKEVEGRTNVTVKLANVARESAEDASEQLTAIWNNFYTGSKSLEYYADVMTALGAATASSTQEISAGLQKFAAVANSVGLSYEYATSALATITATTRESADIVGTSLRTLFARIQGLLQDEEQDDGTNLNKYSKALAQVGIDIKDTDGELKGMNEILDEMGQKWTQLTKAQQMALAQTVAGVRQYTQLIALMENWDFFQENLTVAMGSEGTLQKQADIYAKSWEAARDRVRAATENIYDSLINEDFFIGLDDSFTPVLNGIATIVDSLGGMQGVLAATSLLVNKLYGDKIAQSMRDMATNLSIVTGKESERARILQNESLAIVENLSRTYAANKAEQAKLNILKEEIQIQGLVNSQYDSLNDYQKQIISDEQYKLSLIKQQTQALIEQMSTLQTRVDEGKINLQLEFEDSFNEKRLSAMRKNVATWNKQYGEKSPYRIDLNKRKSDTVFDEIITQMSQLAQKKAGFQTIANQFNSLQEGAEGYRDSLREIIGTYSKMDTSSKTTQQLENELKGISTQAINTGKQIRQLGQLLKLGGVDSKVVNKYVADLQQLAMVENKTEKQQEEFNQKVQEFKDLLASGIPSGRDWADTIVSIGSALGKISMGINAIQSLGRIFTDEDMETSEKLLTALTSASMLLPLLVEGAKLLNFTTQVSVVQEGEQLVVRTSGIAATRAKAAADAALAKGENLVAIKAAAANAALLPQIAVFAAIVGVIAVVAFTVSELARAEEKAKENIQKTTDAYNEQKQELESLNSELETTKNKIEELQDKGSLTIIEQEELDKLRQGLDLLERQKKLQEQQTQNAQKLNALSIERNFATANKSLLESQDLKDKQQYIQYRQYDIPDNFEEYAQFRGLEPGTGEYSSAWENFTNLKGQEWATTPLAMSIDEWYNGLSDDLKDLNADLYATLKQQENEDQLKYLNDTAEAYQLAEENYTAYAEAINTGNVRRDEQALVSMQETLAQIRRNRFSEGEYIEFFIKPVIEENSLEDIYTQFYDGINLDGLFSDQIRKDLLLAGVSVEEFINHIQSIQDRAKEKLNSVDALYMFNYLTGEQIELLVGIDLKEEDINSFEQLYQKIIELQSQRHNIVLKFSIAREQAAEAFKSLITGELLDEQTVKNLQKSFEGIYDLSSLGALSLYDQAKKLNEAYFAAANPDIVAESRIEEYEELLDNLRRQQKEFDRENKESLKRIKIEANISAAEKELETLNEFKMKPIEVEIDDNVINGVIAQMTAIEKASELIGEGFLVEAKNVEALMKTMPALFEDATIDPLSGILKLNETIVNEVRDAAEEETRIRANSLLEQLGLRIQESQDEIDILDSLNVIAKSKSDDTLKNDIKNSSLTIEDKKTAVKAIVMAKIQQSIQETQKSTQTASNAIQDQNKVTDASAQEAKAVAGNWSRAADKINETLYKAFSEAARQQGELSRGATNIANEYVKARSAVGFSKGSSEISWAHSTEVSDQFDEIRKFIDAGFTTLIDNKDWDVSFLDPKKLREQFLSLGFDIDESTFKSYTPDSFLDAFIGSYGEDREKFVDDVNTALNDTTYELAGAMDNYSKLIAALNQKIDGNGSGKASKYTPADKKDLKDIEDRYYEINREIEHQSELLDQINTDIDRTYGIDKLKNYKKELVNLNTQLDNQKIKLDEATNGVDGWLEKDRQRVNNLLGDTVNFDKITGEILNYQNLLADLTKEYNNFIDSYNAAMKAATSIGDEATQERLKEEKDRIDKAFNEKIDAMKNYESSLDQVRQTEQDIRDLERQIADNKLSQAELRLEVVLDVKSMEDAVRELEKGIQEIFNDALTHGIAAADVDYNQANADIALLPEYQSQYAKLKELYEVADNNIDRARIIEDIKNLQGNVIDTAEALIEWWNSIEDIIPDMLDAAAERFNLFTNQLEHNTTVLDTIKELYTLQGVTYKTMDGFNKLQNVSQERLEAQVSQAQIERGRYLELESRLAQAQAELDALDGNEADPMYDIRKKARDAYLEQFNEAEEAYLSLAKSAMETAQQIYMDQLERSVYEFGQVVSNGIGLDLLQDKYDHYIEENERYFDKVNEAYHTISWYNKLQEDIDKTTNSATKDRLVALQKEVDTRRENNKLSQYDLDILNAKYEVLQAQIALEDAQNAKNQLRLVRDRQGNWNYQYTADPNQIGDAEQDLLDAENNWYNIAKKQVTDVTGEIIDTWQECQDKIKEIYSDMTLTDQERSDKSEEIYRYYSQKIQDLEREKQVSIMDVQEAGNASLFTSAVIAGDKLTDLTGVTSEDIRKIVEEGGDSVIGLLTADNETIKNVIASNSELIDLFDNKYSQDLDHMTISSIDFENALRDVIEKAKANFDSYQNKIEDVAEITGTKQDELAEKTDTVATATDTLRENANYAAEAIWNMVDEAQNAIDVYAGLKDEIWETVYALQALAKEQASQVKDSADLGNKEWFNGSGDYNKNLDYNAFISQGLALGAIEYGSKEYQQLFNERENKIGDLGLTPDYTIIEGEKADKEFASINVGDKIGGKYGNLTKEEWLKQFREKSFATGGYTGEFQDAKLAFVHEKELILNKEDTENILSTVNLVRNMGSIFTSIEKMLDNGAIAAMALMAEKLGKVSVETTSSFLEQTIHIDEVSFPNVTSSDEIKEAFNSIANDAAQWARRRKE